MSVSQWEQYLNHHLKGFAVERNTSACSFLGWAYTKMHKILVFILFYYHICKEPNVFTQFKGICQSQFVCTYMYLSVWLQVSPVSYIGNGPHCDQDGNFHGEQEIPGGEEMVDTDEESGHSNLSRERRRCVVLTSSQLRSRYVCSVYNVMPMILSDRWIWPGLKETCCQGD